MADITGHQNIVVENTTGSTVNVTQQLGKSVEYRELQERLTELQRYSERIPAEEIDEHSEYSQKIADQSQLIETFEKDVMNLAATFKRIDINTVRLKTAKEHFESGEFTKARTLLETESSAMANEQARLLAAKEQKTDQLARIQEQLKDNATEYLIYAQTLELDYANSKRFEHIKEEYKKSIKGYGFFGNISAYAGFLYRHNQFTEAELLYQRLMTELKESLSNAERAMTLNNLAILHSAINELSKAEQGCTEALEIYRQLANENPQAYLPDVAETLINLGIYYINGNKNKERSVHMAKEAIRILKDFQGQTSHLTQFMEKAQEILDYWGE